MFDCFDYTCRSAGDTRQMSQIQPRKLAQNGSISTERIGYDRTHCFRLVEHLVHDEMIRQADGTFSGLYVLSGTEKIGTETVSPGSTFFVPASHDAFSIRADGEMRVMEWFGPKCAEN